MIRLMNIILSLCALSVLFWPCVIVAVILKFTGEGEIFFLQERIGKNRKPFKIIKFATMLKDSPNMAQGDITSGDDPRILPLGHFLRKTKINELPQFINVLLGQMSLVGPRPTTPRLFALFSEEHQSILDQIPPGITGIGSIVFRDEETILQNSPKANDVCYREDIIPYKAELEKWYLANRSVLTDIKILFLTAWAIVFPRSDLHFKVFPDVPRSSFMDMQKAA